MTTMNVLKILKRGLLNLDALTALEFTALQKKIQNKDYITSINTFLSRLFQLYNNQMGINAATTKIFLSSYMIMNHRETVTSNDTYAIKLGNNATDMIMNLETLFSDKKVTLKDYNNFMNAFNRYIKFFQVWRERDSLLMARPAINSYFNIDMLREALLDKLNKEDLTDEQKTKITSDIKDYERVLRKLTHNIRLIAGEKGLSFLESKDMPYFKDEEIFQSVEKTVRKAFWDVVKENFENEKYDQMIILLDDLKTIILELNPRVKQEIDGVIDTELLTQMINNGLLNDEGIQTYMNYIISHIENTQQPSEDTNTRLWKENIATMIQKGEKRSVVLGYFFENAFNKLEKIKALTLRIRAQLAQMKEQ